MCERSGHLRLLEPKETQQGLQEGVEAEPCTSKQQGEGLGRMELGSHWPRRDSRGLGEHPRVFVFGST